MNGGGTRKRDSGCARGMYNISKNPARIYGELRGESWFPQKLDIALIVIHHRNFGVRDVISEEVGVGPLQSMLFEEDQLGQLGRQ